MWSNVMFLLATFLSIFLPILATSVARGSRHVQDGTRVVRYDNFDDYLLAIANPAKRQHNQVLKPDSTTGMRRGNSTENMETDLDILGYFKDVPRNRWSCCMLGKLAGDKGFHCHPNFYASRIARRNDNRPQNSKMRNHGKLPAWSWQIMRVFSRCVRHQSAEFHKCCYAAVTEHRERITWYRYRERAVRSRRHARQ